jgi:hypothetical protein
MPQQFVACTDDKVLVKCCLNAGGRDGKCGPCPQCTYMIGTRRCKNPSCADSRLCHVHYKKMYGVKLIDTQYGKGLAATRNFSKNDLICPMGGRRVKANHWTNQLPDDVTAPYSYTLKDVYSQYKLDLRDVPTVDGYVPLKDAKGLPRGPAYTPVTTVQERRPGRDREGTGSTQQRHHHPHVALPAATGSVAGGHGRHPGWGRNPCGL